jgi:hypothetical protein
VYQTDSESFTAPSNDSSHYIEINGDYYEDAEAVEYHGFVYSEYNGEYIRDNDALYVEGMHGSDDDYVTRSELDDVVVKLGRQYRWISDVVEHMYYCPIEEAVVIGSTDYSVSSLKSFFEECPEGVPDCVWDKIPSGIPAYVAA